MESNIHISSFTFVKVTLIQRLPQADSLPSASPKSFLLLPGDGTRPCHMVSAEAQIILLLTGSYVCDARTS